jgi:hypothetical protein
MLASMQELKSMGLRTEKTNRKPKMQEHYYGLVTTIGLQFMASLSPVKLAVWEGERNWREGKEACQGYNGFAERANGSGGKGKGVITQSNWSLLASTSNTLLNTCLPLITFPFPYGSEDKND